MYKETVHPQCILLNENVNKKSYKYKVHVSIIHLDKIQYKIHVSNLSTEFIAIRLFYFLLSLLS